MIFHSRGLMRPCEARFFRGVDYFAETGVITSALPMWCLAENQTREHAHAEIRVYAIS